MATDTLRVLTDSQIETLIMAALDGGQRATEEQLRAWIDWCHGVLVDAALVQNVLKGRMTVTLSDDGPDHWTYTAKG